MQIIDFSGIIISNIFVQNVKDELSEDLLRHMTLNSIRMYHKKFRDKFGKDLFIACDHSSWRKNVFKEYKGNRAGNREASDIDWDQVYGWLNNITNEIDQFTPYHVIQKYQAEADDVIAVLVERTQEFGKCEDVIIISSDKDFLQLQKYPNVYQFSHMKKKLIKEKDPRKFLFEHIVRGDGADGIPNMFSDDDTFITDKRQTPITKKKFDKLYKSYLNGNIDFENDTHKRNFQRNQKMIDLSCIPADLVDEINEIIDEKLKKPDITSNVLMNYLISKRCIKLLEALPDFF